MRLDVRGFLPLDKVSGCVVMSINPAFRPDGVDGSWKPEFSRLAPLGLWQLPWPAGQGLGKGKKQAYSKKRDGRVPFRDAVGLAGRPGLRQT